MAVAIYIPPRNAGLVQKQIDQLWTYQFLVFKEKFYGDGVSTQFPLTGNVLNCQFISGGWKPVGVINYLEADITDTSNKPLYDKSWVYYFTRHRISCPSISGSAVANLDYPPISGSPFYIWYWYNLQKGDRIDNYYREDHVASMEETNPNLSTNVVTNATNFTGNILTSNETDAQKAFEKIDLVATNKTETAAISSYLNQQIINISAGGSFVNYTLLTTTAGLTSNLQTQILDASASLQYQISTLQAASSGGIGSLNNVINPGGNINLVGDGNGIYIVPSDPTDTITIGVSGLTSLATTRALTGSLYNLTMAASANAYTQLYAILVNTSGSGSSVLTAAASANALVQANAFTLTVSASLQNQINSISISGGTSIGSPMYSGYVQCDASSKIFHVTHGIVDPNYTTPVVSLVVPTSASIIYVQGITNRSSTGFDVILTDSPGIPGYKIDWIMPLTNAASGNFALQSYVDDNFTLLTTTAALTSYLQSEIAAISAGGVITTGLSAYTLLSTTAALTANLQAQIAASSGSAGSPIYCGSLNCDATSKVFHISHGSVDVNQSVPVVSLIVPTSSSIIYIQGITNRNDTGFDVILTDSPGLTGYKLDWIMPLSKATSGNFIILPQSYVDNNFTLLTTTAALTANLQTQINAITGGSQGPSADLSLYTLLTTTNSLTSQLVTLTFDTSSNAFNQLYNILVSTSGSPTLTSAASANALIQANNVTYAASANSYTQLYNLIVSTSGGGSLSLTSAASANALVQANNITFAASANSYTQLYNLIVTTSGSPTLTSAASANAFVQSINVTYAASANAYLMATQAATALDYAITIQASANAYSQSKNLIFSASATNYAYTIQSSATVFAICQQASATAYLAATQGASSTSYAYTIQASSTLFSITMQASANAYNQLSGLVTESSATSYLSATQAATSTSYAYTIQSSATVYAITKQASATAYLAATQAASSTSYAYTIQSSATVFAITQQASATAYLAATQGASATAYAYTIQSSATSFAITMQASANAYNQAYNLISSTSAAILLYDFAQDNAMSGSLLTTTFASSANSFIQSYNLTVATSSALINYDSQQDAAMSGSLLSIVSGLTGSLYSMIQSSSPGSSGNIGTVNCSAGINIYTVSHNPIVVSSTIVLANVLIPNAYKPLFVHGITNRTSNSFDIVLDSSPTSAGYSIYWLITSGGSSSSTDTSTLLNKDSNLSDVSSPALARNNINQGSISWSISGGVVTDCSANNVFVYTLTGNSTLLTPLNLKDGSTYTWFMKQDAVGNRSITFNTGTFKFPSAIVPIATTAANSVDIYSGLCISNTLYMGALFDLR